jgi:uncharacterized protein YndB with AHSA1/START domain
MADIFHDFLVKAPAAKVFTAVSTPQGMDHWWTKRSAGEPKEGAEYELWFGPQFDWRGKVTRCKKNSEFELEITRADADWIGTRVGFRLEEKNGSTNAHFYHVEWSKQNDHWRISCYCWAMYLRILRRWVEHGEFVPYERRLDV